MTVNSYHSTTDQLFDEIWTGDLEEVEILIEDDGVDLARTESVDRTQDVQHAKTFQRDLAIIPGAMTQFTPLDIAIIRRAKDVIKKLIHDYASPISDNTILIANSLGQTALASNLRDGQHLIPVLVKIGIDYEDFTKYISSKNCRQCAKKNLIIDRDFLEDAYNSDALPENEDEEAAKDRKRKAKIRSHL